MTWNYTLKTLESTRKLSELINEFGNVPGFKINTQKYFALLYTNNKRSERKIKEAMHHIKKNKIYLGINLPKYTKDLYSENYKKLMKEVGDDTNRWKDKPGTWTGKINFVKMNVLPKAIYPMQSLSNHQCHFSKN